jgi:outer membrane receptor for Fe3+-dicitrate
MKSLVPLIVFLFISAVSFSQTTNGNISGQVKDKAGKAAEGITVGLEGTNYGTLTGSNGNYELKNIPAGDYTLVATALGFSTIKQAVTVKAGETATMNLDMAEKNITLKEVAITATGIKQQIKDVPGTVSVLDSKDIQESGAQSVGQIIGRIPGVNYLDEDGRGLKPNIGLRGLDPLRNRNLLVLVDGKFPIGMTYYGDPAAYYMIPVEQVERIEVMKGASPVLYGGYSVGGVVNMITRRGKYKPETKFSAGYGSYDAFTAQLTSGANNGKTNYFISGLRKEGQGYRDRADYMINDYTVKLGSAIDSTSEVSIYLNAFTENSQTPGGLTQKQYDENPRQSQHQNDQFYSKRFSTAISYNKAFRHEQSISASVYGNYFERNWWIAYKNPKNDGFLRDIHAAGTVLDYNIKKDVLKMKNSLIAGVRVHTDRLDDINIKGDTATSRTGTTTGNKINTSFIYEGFVYDELSILKNLVIAPGIRYTMIEYKRNDFFLERQDEIQADAVVYSAGIIYKLEKFGSHRIFTNISKGFQPPTLNSALAPTTIDAGVDLEPETSMNYEAGLRTSPKDWISLSVSAYRMDFKNKVITENGVNKNAGSSYHRGIEAELELGDWKGFSLFANGALQKATFTSGADSGKFLPNAPEEMAAAGIRYSVAFKKNEIVANVFNNYVGKQYSDSKNTEIASDDGKTGPVPAYSVMNFTVRYNRPHWGVYFNANNVLDEKYFTLRWASWNGIIPSPGRNFLAGVNFKF